MSAHLKFGTIHPRTMAADLGRGKGAQAYLRELAFRDFYAAVLLLLARQRVVELEQAASTQSTSTTGRRTRKKRFEAWKAGETGFPIVDAGMRQLLKPVSCTTGSG